MCNVFTAYLTRRPLVQSVPDDLRIWFPEKHGLYTVNSAYNLFMNKLFESDHLRVSGDWSLIWKLKVPPRVKLLLWRDVGTAFLLIPSFRLEVSIVLLAVFIAILVWRIHGICFYLAHRVASVGSWQVFGVLLIHSYIRRRAFGRFVFRF